MKVMLLITGLSVGGAERQVSDLADSLFSKGHEILLVYMTGEALVKPSNNGVSVVALGMNRSFVSVIKAFFELRRIIGSFKPDVIHSHMVHANIMARLIRVISKVPVLVSTAHSTNEGRGIRMLAYRLTDGLTDISTNVSVEAVRIFEQRRAVPHRRMTAIHNGIDVNKFSVNLIKREKIRAQLDVNDLKVFLAVGRLVDAKDFPNLLAAFSTVHKRHADSRLLIVGDGVLKAQLLEIARKLEILDCLRFLGTRDDVPDLMNAADYFVLSSAWEGFGLVVAEAMATEKVVIATDAGGVAEVLGDCGLLVPARNPELLAKAMLKALELHPEEARLLKIAARQRVVSQYGLDNVSNKWLELYEKLLNNKIK